MWKLLMWQSTDSTAAAATKSTILYAGMVILLIIIGLGIFQFIEARAYRKKKGIL